ncbi:MAG: peptide chain release factor N(5)-glutamine methyltransferase [Terracidiphilus sp.]
MTLAECIARGEVQLRAGPHSERARRDAELLLQFVLGRDRAFVLAHPDDQVGQHSVERYFALIQKRMAGEPVQYIVGEQEFYGLPFRVTPDVLIPRLETEHLVEKTLELAERFEQPRIVDVGTGSGAIAVALAHWLPLAQITAVDISIGALTVADKNAKRNGLVDRVRFIESDLLAAVANERFDIVVSNPPYVPSGDRESLSVEVREHEPSLALFAGEDGMDVYRRLIPEAFSVLAPGGFVVLEIGYGQAESVTALLAQAGFQHIETLPDLQGIPRILCGQRPR